MGRKDSKTVHFEEKTLRLYTSDSTIMERTTKVDHFIVKAQLSSKDSKLLRTSPALNSTLKERTTTMDHIKVKAKL
jgi:hypothetical protein